MTDENDTILITGGTGFAGWHLVEQLLETKKAEQIHVTSMSSASEEMLKVLPAENFHTLDLTDKANTEQVLTSVKPQQIYNLASIPTAAGSFEHANDILFNNIGLQLNILELVKQHLPDSRVLMVGSADGYGSSTEVEIPILESHPLRPINPYAVSKASQELLSFAYGQSWNLQLLLVRPFNHIGERQLGDFAIPTFAKQIVAVERGEQTAIQVGNLDGVRDFTDVKDVVKAYQVVMEKGEVLSPYNIGSGTGIKMQELMDLLLSLSNAEIKLETDPKKIRPLDIPVIIANNEKIRELGWSPTIPLKDTLQRVLDYWRSQ